MTLFFRKILKNTPILVFFDGGRPSACWFGTVFAFIDAMQKQEYVNIC